MSDLLANVRNKPSLLVPLDNRELVSFTVSLARPMGLKRSVGKGSFIDSVLDTLDDFYGDVVQHLQEWQPAAPKLQKSAVEETDPPAGKQAEPTVFPDAQSKPNQTNEEELGGTRDRNNDQPPIASATDKA